MDSAIIVVLALVAVFGLIGAVAVMDYFFGAEKADAAGCLNSKAFNASKGRCFGH